ncbi:hypothetical protein HZC27_01515 [Candidatus Roizmanbacteria bacterium]|nr:hypothetical protein [Candidatus Roizmanbacteria bacterium]
MPANFDHLLLSNNELLIIKDNFIHEIQKASLGQESSVSFLPHTIPQTSPLKDGEMFQVMTIGGSVFKSALVKKQPNECVVLSEKDDAIPRFGSDRIFLEFITSHLDPTVTYLSLNLAYPLDPVFRDNLLDGIFVRGGKEHRFDGLVGKKVGESIEEFVFTRLKRKVHVTVANDTVCLFISDVTLQSWNTTVAGIIGTGTNYAIGMNKQIINLQSGSFNAFTQTPSGKIIDKESIYPGKGITDKEVAGAYLFKHFNIIAKENNLSFSPLSSTRELSQLAEKNEGDGSKLAQIILERSASFAACQIAGIVEFKQQTTHGPLTFVMEGALYWDAWHYKEFIHKYIERFKVLKKLRFSPIRHHSIRGGIKLLSGLS